MTQWDRTQALAKAAGFIDYADYLRSEHWKELKRRCDLRQCIVCGTFAALVAHHKRYRALLDVTPSDIAPMCERCHEDFHKVCRKKGIEYVDVEEPEIVRIVTEFRATPWYQRKAARRERKLARRLAAKPKPQLFWVCDPRGERMVVLPLAKNSGRSVINAIRHLHRIKATLVPVQ